MAFASVRRLPGGFHYAWAALAITFLILLSAGGTRATPGVILTPLEQAFGWSAATVSLAIGVNLVLYGLVGPFAAALMQRFGVRRTVLSALVLLSLSVASSSLVTAPWQLILTWGGLVGLGSGTLAMVFGAIVVNRWFAARRGLALGILAASTASGQLVFLPLLASVVEAHGWRPVTWIAAGAAAVMIPIVLFFLPESPAAAGLRPYGATGVETVAAPPSRENPITAAFSVLGRGVKSRDFWLLFGSFFVCGASTNGLIGTHMISYCLDNGIPEVRGASLLAAMGIFDLAGTTLSGWLSDRFSNRVLLSWYYGLRGLSLLYLPFSDFSFASLSLFATFYGLDWLATVPPTVRLANDIFGKKDAPVIFGWIFTGHQLGAASIAVVAGVLRSSLGSYAMPVMLSGVLCMIAALMVLWIGRTRSGAGRARLEPEAA